MLKPRQSGHRGLEKRKLWDYGFTVLFLASLLFMIWKAPKGYIVNDEAFYLTIPYRLLQGDKLLVNEWHLSQLSGFLLYPLVKGYFSLGGTSEGMILIFRYVFIFFYGAVSGMYIYLRMSRLSKPGALFMSIGFMSFVPYNIMALSYNSMCIMFMVLMAVSMATAGNSKFLKMLAGAMFAAAVLCCPYLCILFFIYTAMVFVSRLRKGPQREREELLSMNTWLFFSTGIAFLAVIFVLFVMSRTDLQSILKSIPHMLDDPEHGRKPLTEMVYLYINHVFFSRKLPMLSFGAGFVLLAAIAIDKKRNQHKGLYLILASAASGIFMLMTALRYRSINYYMMPLSILGLICYVLSEKKNKALFIFLFAAGWIYSFLICLSSNNFYYALTGALATANGAALYFSGNLMDELLCKKEKSAVNKLAVAALVLTICLQIGAVMRDRAELAFGNTEKDGINHIATLTKKVEKGVAKGLYFSQDDYNDYNQLLSDTEPVREAPGENVLYFTWETWPYLMDTKGNASFSAWMSLGYPDYAVKRLLEYWEMNEEKPADVIYVNKRYENAQEIIKLLNLKAQAIEERENCYIARDIK